MRRQTIRTFARTVAALMAIAAPRAALAQGADAGRVAVTIGPGIQLTTTNATTTTTFEAFSEDGTMTA